MKLKPVYFPALPETEQNATIQTCNILCFDAHIPVVVIYYVLMQRSEYGFEESLSTLGLVSGLFSAVWSAGCVLNSSLDVLLKCSFYNSIIKPELFTSLYIIFMLKHVLWADHRRIHHTNTELRMERRSSRRTCLSRCKNKSYANRCVTDHFLNRPIFSYLKSLSVIYAFLY